MNVETRSDVDVPTQMFISLIFRTILGQRTKLSSPVPAEIRQT